MEQVSNLPASDRRNSTFRSRSRITDDQISFSAGPEYFAHISRSRSGIAQRVDTNTGLVTYNLEKNKYTLRYNPQHMPANYAAVSHVPAFNAHVCS